MLKMARPKSATTCLYRGARNPLPFLFPTLVCDSLRLPQVVHGVACASNFSEKNCFISGEVQTSRTQSKEAFVLFSVHAALAVARVPNRSVFARSMYPSPVRQLALR